MSTLRLSTGHEIPLDGDLLAVLEGLYREVTLRREFKGSFEDMMREIEGIVAQMSAEDRQKMMQKILDDYRPLTPEQRKDKLMAIPEQWRDKLRQTLKSQGLEVAE